MTIPKSLPVGSNHHVEVHRVSNHMQGIADAAAKAQTAPRPAGPKRVMTAEIPNKSLHHTVTGT
jgi:hypothetical protein